MENKFRWIKNDIDISGFYHKLPKDVIETMQEAEQADLNNDEGMFICICEGLECQAKLYVPDVISTKEWDLLCQKYWGE